MTDRAAHAAHDRNMTIDPREADDVKYEQRLAVAMSRIKHEPDTVAEIFFGEEFSNYCHGNAAIIQGLAALTVGNDSVFGSLIAVTWRAFLREQTTRDWLVREYGDDDGW